MRAISLLLKSTRQKPECEDALYSDEANGVFVVVDGVTRFRYMRQTSPAAKAAREVARSFGSYLSQSNHIDEKTWKEAFAVANDKAKQINQQETLERADSLVSLWDGTDFVLDDLAGVVLAAIVWRKGIYHYAFIGDCNIRRLSRNGKLIWKALSEETNKVEQARNHFVTNHSEMLSQKDETNRLLSRQIMHTQYRNNPQADYPTYGVLTGEASAIHDMYLYAGDFEADSNETVVLHTDGLDPYFDELNFRTLLVTGEQGEIERYLQDNAKRLNASDDKAIILLRNT